MCLSSFTFPFFGKRGKTFKLKIIDNLSFNHTKSECFLLTFALIGLVVIKKLINALLKNPLFILCGSLTVISILSYLLNSVVSDLIHSTYSGITNP